LASILTFLRKHWALEVFLLLAAVLTAGVLGFLEPVERVLDSERATFRIGDLTVSAYDVVSALLIIALTF
jgi:hypothetical protein